MSRKLVIDPVTRIEGHGKVTIQLNDAKKVDWARLNVVEFRGYEKFVQGHPYWEAPMMLQRVCGICFVSHHLAGAKALDDMVGVGYGRGVQPLATVEKMRRLGHYAQQLQSHVAAYFYLTAPEMLFGVDAPPDQRNVQGLIEADPELVKRVLRLRKWGQELITTVFGKRMHGIHSVPGGVNKNLSPADRDRFLKGEDGLLSIDEVIEGAEEALKVFYGYHEAHRDWIDGFAVVPGLNLCLVNDKGNVDYFHGDIRVVDHNREVVEEFDYHDYLDHFEEATEQWSYMKFPYLKRLGREAGSARVGCLARVNVTRDYETETPLAREALARFHDYNEGKASNATLHTNWARAIEILHSAEQIRNLLNDSDLQKTDLVLPHDASTWVGEGVGVVEAPRGTLLHHYRADKDGAMTFANLIVATTQNNQVINRTITSVAEEYLTDVDEITDGLMNHVEFGIRAYDPCLSCATHAVGQMPLIVTVQGPDGTVLAQRER